MTKETKIGLLVGLAFIILFAIILSEKGAPQRDARTPNFDVALGKTSPGPIPGQDTPLSQDGRLPVEKQLEPIVQTAKAAPTGPLTEEPIVSAAPQDDDSLPVLPDSVVALFAGNNDAMTLDRSGDAPKGGSPTNAAPAVKRPGPLAPAVAVPTRTEVPGPMVAQAQPKTAPVYPSPTSVNPPVNPPAVHDTPVRIASAAPSGGPVTTDRPIAVSNGRNSETAVSERGSPMGHGAAAPAGPMTVKATHVVEEGDCLSKIAAKYYGRSTPDRVKALADANKEILKEHHGVRVSDKLTIPELAGYEDKFEAVAGFKPKAADSTAAKKAAESIKTPETAVADSTPAPRKSALVPAPNNALSGQTNENAPRVPKPIEDAPVASDSRVAMKSPRSAEATAVSDSRDSRAVVDGKVVKVASPSSKYRIYEVKPGDTLSSIARRELGSERRFKTIYSMNRDIIANKHALKPGTKIKLPPAEDASMASSLTTGHDAAGAEP